LCRHAHSLFCTVNVKYIKYSKHGAYIQYGILSFEYINFEYDILSFSIHNSRSTQNVLKMSSLNNRLLTLSTF